MYACAMKDVLKKNVPILAIASYNNYMLYGMMILRIPTSVTVVFVCV